MRPPAFKPPRIQSQHAPYRHPYLLSQGEVRPGVRQGQFWGVPSGWALTEAPPVRVITVNTEIR